MDEEYIVSPEQDRYIAFLAGLFGTAFGLAAAIVVAYRWAVDAPDGRSDARWRHARTIRKWAAAGFAIPVTFAAVTIALYFGIEFLSGAGR